MIRFVVVVVFVMCWTLTGFGQCLDYDQQLPILINAASRCLVQKDGGTGVFVYRYTLSNGLVSTGCISSFELDVRRSLGTVDLPSSGLVDYPRYVRREALQQAGAVEVIPVGVPSLPTFNSQTSAWSAGFSVRGSITWIRALPRYLVAPGQQLDGLVLTSHGLPGLRNFVISPKYEPVPDTTRYETTEMEEKQFTRLLDSIKTKGTTIGPVSPPLNCDAPLFLDTLVT